MQIVTKRVRSWLPVLGAVLAASVTAMVAHAILPAPVDELVFDGPVAVWLGFPLTAVLYFVLLFCHCAWSVWFCQRQAPGWNWGWRLGLLFAGMYMLGMQEVVVEASPFEQWGWDFVRYQTYMGLGDALPALLLCLWLGWFYARSQGGFRTRLTRKESTAVGLETPQRQSAGSAFRGLVLITAVVTGARSMGYVTGSLTSNIQDYAAASFGWTALLGLWFGVSFYLLAPLWVGQSLPRRRAAVASLIIVGLNWIWFNSFIGLVFAGAWGQMLLRSGLDTAVLLSAFWYLAADQARS